MVELRQNQVAIESLKNNEGFIVIFRPGKATIGSWDFRRGENESIKKCFARACDFVYRKLGHDGSDLQRVFSD